MVSTEYIYHNLEEEIAKYTHVPIVIDTECVNENKNNKHQIREDFKKMLIENIGMSDLESTDLEIGVFNAAIEYANSLKIQLSWKSQMFIETYINISRSVYSNLKADSYIGNLSLKDRMIKNKEFLPHMLPYMLCQDIFPERWRDIVDKNKLRFKAAYEVKQVAMSDMIQCSRCKSRKVSYYELQTRSGDEASTLFMNCLICGKKWKQ
jgi:DNA-directed RNA polymerase subunit M/transcription elongation factor TFIIS